MSILKRAVRYLTLLSLVVSISLPGGAVLAAQNAGAPAVLLQDNFESGVISSHWLKPQGNWTIVDDPDGSGSKALFSDSNDTISTLTTAAGQFGDYAMEFRVRYDTPYPGYGDGGKPDGSHYPNWEVAVKQSGGQSVSVNDSYVWNGLILYRNGSQLEQRTEGVRPKNTWYNVKIESRQNRYKAYVNGELMLDKIVDGISEGAIAFKAQNVRLWLDDLTVSQLPPGPAEPDRPPLFIQENFESGGISSKWSGSGAWAVVDDPSNPGNKVYAVDSLESISELSTNSRLYTDYSLAFRVRFDTPYKAYPGNDGVHWPHWGVYLNKDAKLRFVDSLIWNAQFSWQDTAKLAESSRIMKKNVWYDFKIDSFQGMYKVYINGNLAAAFEAPGVPAGAVGFLAMNEKLWIDDIRLSLYPEALLFDTFDLGLLAQRWDIGGNWTVGRDGGNAYARLTDADRTSGLLRSKDRFGDGVLQFQAKHALQPGGESSVAFAVYGDGSGWFGMKLNKTTDRLELGREQGGVWTALASSDSPMSVIAPENVWHQYRVTLDGNDTRVYVDDTLAIDYSGTEAKPAGAIGFAGRLAELSLDNVLLRPLPVPVYQAEPLQPGAIFEQSGKKGFLLKIANADAEPHTIRAEFEIRRDGETSAVDANTVSFILQPGQSEAGRELVLQAPQTGPYRMSLKLSSDGKLFDNRTLQADVLADKPVFSPLYEPKFGYNTGLDEKETSIFGKGAVRWARNYAFFEGRTQNGDQYNFDVPERNVERFRSVGGRSISLYMDQGNGHTLNGIKNVAGVYAAAANHFKGTRQDYEVWNEPNHPSFWLRSPIYGGDYAALLKEVYNAIKRSDADASVAGGALSEADATFLRDMLAAGAFDYMDVLSYHPYRFPELPENIIEHDVGLMKKEMDVYGGWVNHLITEQGYPTHAHPRGSSEPDQAKLMVRTQLIGNGLDVLQGLILYNLRDVGSDPSNIEHRYGVLRNDYSAKPAYIALSVMARAVANAEYMGALPAADGQYVQVYRKFDGTPVVAAWSLAPGNVALKAKAGVAEVTNMYGNVNQVASAGGVLNIAVSDEPVYIQGNALDKALFYAASETTRAGKAAFVNEKLSEIENAALKTALMQAFAAPDRQIAGLLTSAQASGRGAELKQAVRQLFAFAGSQVIGAYRDGGLTAAQASIITDGVYRYAEAMMKTYAAMDTDTLTAVPSLSAAEAAIEAARQAIAAKAGAKGTLVTSERMLGKAKEALKLAKLASVDAPAEKVYSSYAEARRVLAEQLAAMAQSYASAEPVFYRETLFNVLPKIDAAMIGQNKTVTSALTNGTGVPAEGKVELEFPPAWGMGMLSETATVNPGEQWVKPWTFALPGDLAPGDYTVKVKAYLGGRTAGTVDVKLKAAVQIQARLAPITASVQEMEVINLELTNVGSTPFEGTVKVTGPAGDLLSPVTGGGDSSIRIEGNSARSVAYRFNSGGKTPFNEYKVRVQVTGKEGNKVVDERIPLDFLLVNRAPGAVKVDGDKKEWSAAFPMRMLEKSKNFDSSNVSGVVYAMNDDRYLYLLIEAKDAFHSQVYSGTDIWKGDSVQISLDPANNKSDAYDNDDYEVGFALDGEMHSILSAKWTGASDAFLDEAKAAVVRNEQTGTTTYEIALPKTYMPEATFAKGSLIGINVCLNDADRENMRKRFIQVTKGTCDTKNPSFYAAWIFVEEAGADSGGNGNGNRNGNGNGNGNSNGNGNGKKRQR